MNDTKPCISLTHTVWRRVRKAALILTQKITSEVAMYTRAFMNQLFWKIRCFQINHQDIKLCEIVLCLDIKLFCIFETLYTHAIQRERGNLRCQTFYAYKSPVNKLITFSLLHYFQFLNSISEKQYKCDPLKWLRQSRKCSEFPALYTCSTKELFKYL